MSSSSSCGSKGHRIEAQDPEFWRTDDYGREMCWPDYGNKTSEFGWTIGHITPVSLDGTHHIWNLRPLHLESSAAL